MGYKNPFETAMSGRDLKDWIWYNTKTATKYSLLADRMMAAFNLDDNKYYMAKMCGEKPVIKEVEEKGKSYDLPCD